MQVDGATVLVTGASSGIGAALAPLLAQRGATVAIVARRADRLADVLQRCQQHAPASRLYVADLGDTEVMLLRNHGTLAVGASVAEAFNNGYRLERACRAQLLAQGANDRMLLPAPAVIGKTAHLYRPEVRRPMGLLEWPAMRRLADRLDPSYKT